MRHKPRVVIHLAGYIEVGEVCHAASTLPAQQCRQEPRADRRRRAPQRRGFRLLQHLRRLRPAANRTAGRVPPPRADQSLCLLQGERRTSPGRCRRGGVCGAASLRYFNASGADAGGLIGEAHDPETHLIPLAIDAALGLRPCLVVHGSDYPTEDGSCVRDYVHVTDLADAHLRAVRWLLLQGKTGRHDAFNLGSGIGYSVKQVVDCVGKLAGQPVPHVLGARRPGDSPRLVGAIAKAPGTARLDPAARPRNADRGCFALAPCIDALSTRPAAPGFDWRHGRRFCLWRPCGHGKPRLH